MSACLMRLRGWMEMRGWARYITTHAVCLILCRVCTARQSHVAVSREVDTKVAPGGAFPDTIVKSPFPHTCCREGLVPSSARTKCLGLPDTTRRLLHHQLPMTSFYFPRQPLMRRTDSVPLSWVAIGKEARRRVPDRLHAFAGHPSVGNLYIEIHTPRQTSK